MDHIIKIHNTNNEAAWDEVKVLILNLSEFLFFTKM